MEVDDAAMGIEDGETSTGWCRGVTSFCAAGSTGFLLLDSRSDEHLCTPKFADLIPTSPDRSPLERVKVAHEWKHAALCVRTLLENTHHLTRKFGKIICT